MKPRAILTGSAEATAPIPHTPLAEPDARGRIATSLPNSVSPCAKVQNEPRRHSPLSQNPQIRFLVGAISGACEKWVPFPGSRRGERDGVRGLVRNVSMGHGHSLSLPKSKSKYVLDKAAEAMVLIERLLPRGLA